MVAQGGASGVEDGVGVATTQPNGHLAGHSGGHPALQGLTQHQGLRIQPPSLVEQATETPALSVVVGDGVLVVNGAEQSLVRDEQQGHAGRLVDTAALGLDDAVLDLVGHTKTMPSAH